MATPYDQFKKYLTKNQVKKLVKAQKGFSNQHADERVEAIQEQQESVDQQRRYLQNRGLASNPTNIISGLEPKMKNQAQASFNNYNENLKQVEDAQTANLAAKYANQTIRARNEAARRKAEEAAAAAAAADENYKNAMDAYTSAQSEYEKEYNRAKEEEKKYSGMSTEEKIRYGYTHKTYTTSDEGYSTTQAYNRAGLYETAQAAKARADAAKIASDAAREAAQQALKDSKRLQIREAYERPDSALYATYVRNSSGYNEYQYNKNELSKKNVNLQAQLRDVRSEMETLNGDTLTEEQYKRKNELAATERGINMTIAENNRKITAYQEKMDGINMAIQVNQESAKWEHFFYGKSEKEIESYIEEQEYYAKAVVAGHNATQEGARIKSAEYTANANQARYELQKRNSNKYKKYELEMNGSTSDRYTPAYKYNGDPKDYKFENSSGSKYYTAVNDNDTLMWWVAEAGDAKAKRFASNTDHSSANLTETEIIAEKHSNDDSMYFANYAKYMDEDEKNMFNFIYNNHGAGEADRYFEYLLPELDNRGASEIDSGTRKAVEGKGFLSKAGISVATVPLNTTMSMMNALQQIENIFSGRKTTKTQARFYNSAQLIRNGISENFSATGQFLYGTGMSMLDSMANRMLGAAGPALMSMSAYTSTLDEAMSRGLSSEKAQATAIFAGIAESLFEEISWEKYVKVREAGNFKEWLWNTVKASFNEGTEEVNTDLANALTDYLINGEGSELMTQYGELVESGMSSKDAAKEVASNFGIQLLQSYAGGALSGGIMTGFRSGTNFFRRSGGMNSMQAASVGQSLTSDQKESIRNHDFGNKELNEMAQDKKASNAEMGRLYVQMQIDERAAAIAETVKKSSGGEQALKEFQYKDSTAKQIAQKVELTNEEVAYLYEQRMIEQEADVVQALGNNANETIGTFQSVIEGNKITMQQAEEIADNDTAAQVFKDTYGGDGTAESILATANIAAQKNATTYGVAVTEDGKRIISDRTIANNAEATLGFRDASYVGSDYKTQTFATEKGSVTVELKDGDTRFMDAYGKAAITVSRAVANITGANIKVVDTFANRKSEKGYTPNGYYDHASNTIYIALDSDRNVGYIVSHELTHWLQANSPAAYETYRQVVTDTINNIDLENIDNFNEDTKKWIRAAREANPDVKLFDALVEYEIQQYNESDLAEKEGNTRSREEAVDEVLAEVGETMLDDETVQREISERDIESAGAIAKFLKKIADGIKRMLDNLPKGTSGMTSRETEVLVSSATNMENIAKAWANMVNEVRKNGVADGSRSEGVQNSSRGRGYDGYSMSVNAREAYENGEMPKSKWTKASIINAISKIDANKAELLKGASANALANRLLEKTSWHHTSEYYNKTDFYSVNEDTIRSLTDDDIREIVADRNASKSEDTSTYNGDFEYVEWTGTRNHPKATVKKLSNVTIEERRSFYNVYDSDGNLIVSKKIGSRGTYATNNDERRAREEAYRKEKQAQIDRSTSAAKEFFAKHGDNVEYSQSGNVYPAGRKPSGFDVAIGLESFFKQGEQRLAYDYVNKSYFAETWDGNNFIPESVNTEGMKYSIRSITNATGIDATMSADGYLTYTINGKQVYKVTAEHVKESALGGMITVSNVRGFISAEEAKRQYEGVAKLMNMIKDTQYPDAVWAMAGSNLFSALKSNSDAQYGTTIDFTTVCRKTQEMITAMSTAMKENGRGLTREEVTELQARVHKSGGEVPCPVCYVFSRWAGIGGVLDKIRDLQNKYDAYTTKELQKAQNKLADEIKKNITVPGQKNLSTSTGINMALDQRNTELDQMNYDLERIELNEKKGTATDEELKRKAEIKAKMPTLQLEVEMLREYVWIRDVRTKDNYSPVELRVLYDLDNAAEFSQRWPEAWKYRTTRGPATGKAILPYSDMRLGDFILGVKSNSATGNTKFTEYKGGKLNDKQARAITSAIARVRAQNLIGGQRYQSTSDFRYEYALDYLQSFFEAQALGSKMQTYTKVVEFAEWVASVGGDCNLSVMPKGAGYKNGVLDFSAVTGMNYDAAVEANDKYDNVQLILVGINDEHIKLALEDSPYTHGDKIGFVIPYHASGASVEFIRSLVENLGEEYRKNNYRDYSDVQNDHEIKDATPEQRNRAEIRKDILTKGKKWTASKTDLQWMTDEANRATDITGMTFDELRAIELKALSGDQEAIKVYQSWTSDLLLRLYNKMHTQDGSEYGTKLSSTQAGSVFPHEYWDVNSTRANAYVNGFLFRSYCYNLGLIPRFTGLDSSGKRVAYKSESGEKVEYGDFSDCTGYWKTLIDRPMYANDGTYREQTAINVTNFNEEMTKPSWGEKEWGKYKIQEPNTARAKGVGKAYAAELTAREGHQNSIRTREEIMHDVERKVDEVDGETLDKLISGMQRRNLLNFKTMERVLDGVAGKNVTVRNVLAKLIEKPFNEAGGKYARGVRERSRELRDKMAELGITKKKESAAIQRYGEGCYQTKAVVNVSKNADGTFHCVVETNDDIGSGEYDYTAKEVRRHFGVYGKRIVDTMSNPRLADDEMVTFETKIAPYTLDMLQAEHPDNWQSIIEAEKYMRDVYDRYVDEINEMLERVYPWVFERGEDNLSKLRDREQGTNATIDDQKILISKLSDQLKAAEKRLAGMTDTATQGYVNEKATIRNLNRQLAQANGHLTKLEAKLAVQQAKVQALQEEINSGEIARNKRLMKRDDYFHHFQEMQGAIGGIANIIRSNTEIDPSLIGKSQDTKPKSKWVGILQKRLGGAYTEDAVNGLYKYIATSEYILAYDPFIAEMRDLAKALRDKGGQMYREAGTVSELDASKRAGRTTLWLEDWTNSIAGKSNKIDRAVSDFLGNRLYMQLAGKLNSAVKKSKLMFNLRSALVQISNITNAPTFIQNPKDWVNGVLSYAKMLKNEDMRGIFNQSNFMSQRLMEDYEFSEKTFMGTVDNFAGWLLSAGDQLSSTLTWWAAYQQYARLGNEGVKRYGFREYDSAIDYADDVVRRTHAGRGVGEVPLALQSKTLNLVAPFQLEVLNTFENLRQQIGRKNALGIVGMEVAIFLVNSVTRSLFGDGVLGFDFIHALLSIIATWADDDEDKDAAEKSIESGQALLGEVVSGVPFASQLATLLIPDEDQRQKWFGESDPTRYGTGTLGIKAVSNIPYTTGKTIVDLIRGETVDWWRFVDMVTDFVPGGTQMARTAKGIETMAKGYSESKSGRVQFAVDRTPLKVAQAVAFGKWASQEAREYLGSLDPVSDAGYEKSGFKLLSEGKSAAFKQFTKAGGNGKDFFKATKEMDAQKSEKDASGNTIAGSLQVKQLAVLDKYNLTDDQLEIVWLTDSKHEGQTEMIQTWKAMGGSVDKFLHTYTECKCITGDGRKERITELLNNDKTLTDAQRSYLMTAIGYKETEPKEEKVVTEVKTEYVKEDPKVNLEKMGYSTGTTDKWVSSGRTADEMMVMGSSKTTDVAAAEIMRNGRYSEDQVRNAWVDVRGNDGAEIDGYTAIGGSAMDFVEIVAKAHTLDAKDASGKSVSGLKKKRAIELVKSYGVTDAQYKYIMGVLNYKV